MLTGAQADAKVPLPALEVVSELGSEHQGQDGCSPEHQGQDEASCWPVGPASSGGTRADGTGSSKAALPHKPALSSRDPAQGDCMYPLMLSFPGDGEKWGGDGVRANVKAPETVELPQPLHRKCGGTKD